MKTALITGATVGIGYELSKQFAQDGYQLVLVARNEDKLKERQQELSSAYGVSVTVIPMDLSNPEAAAQIESRLKEKNMEIEILVNNAGFGLMGKFVELDLQRQLDMIQVNVAALTELTGRFLPAMLARGSGGILNVASTAAFQAGPLQTVYYATKAYVLLFSEGLANELKGTGVRVSALCPGPTATEFQERAGFGDILLMKGMVMSAEKVAKIGYKQFQRGKRIIIPGLMNKLLAQSTRFTPRAITTAVVRFLQESR